ncbi:MAG: O-antigen ligase family protein [Pseudomonadaceae bacterium]|nr:O-antigen ligase family protein [Pseudomonadaceae bacterium]
MNIFGEVPWHDRIWRNGVLIVVCLVSVLLLSSQSAASYGTYILALSMLFGFSAWKDVFQVRLCWLIVALIGYLSLSSFWSEPFEFREFVSVATRGLLTFLFVVALAECQLRGQLQRWLGRAFAVVGFVAVVAAIVVFFVEAPQDGRLNGLGQLDNHVVAALVWAVLIVFALHLILREPSGSWKLLGWLSLCAYVFAVVLSDSRTAWIAALLGSVTYVLASFLNSAQRFTQLVVAVGVLVFVLVCLAAIVPGLADLLFPRGWSFRPEIWQASLEKIGSSGWLFGLGVLTSDDFPIDGIVFAHSHNMYLSVLYQGGIVGLGLFLLVLFVTASTFLRFFVDQDSKLGLSILTVAASAYLLDGHELIDKVGDTWFLVWMPVGLAMGLAWRPETTPAESYE